MRLVGMITQDDSVAVNEPCGSNDFHRSHKTIFFKNGFHSCLPVNSHVSGKPTGVFDLTRLNSGTSSAEEAFRVSDATQRCCDKPHTGEWRFSEGWKRSRPPFPPGMWFAANGAPGDSRRPPKISPNMREGNENTTRGEETSITSISAFSSKRIFPLLPPLFSSFMYFLWQNTSLRPHPLTDMLGIIRFTIKEHQAFEDILPLLNISFQGGKLWVTFPLEIKKKKKKVRKAICSYISVCEFFLPPLSLFNSLIFPHVSPHLLISQPCPVITWDRGGFTVRSALCSFPCFLSSICPACKITVMLRRVLCSRLSAPWSSVGVLFSHRRSEASRHSWQWLVFTLVCVPFAASGRIAKLHYVNKERPMLCRLEGHSLAHLDSTYDTECSPFSHMYLLCD